MKHILRRIVLIILIFITSNTIASQLYSSTTNLQLCNANKVIQKSDYTLKVCVAGTWYLITYNSDGYIINIVEDDE